MTTLTLPNNPALARRTSEDARQYAYRVIKYCILELFLAPGQKLNEMALAKSLNVSRTPVHDTSFRLSRENLVDILPNRGAFVSKISPQRIEQAIWTHTHLGTSVLHSIYIKNTGRDRLSQLRGPLDKLDQALYHGDLSLTPGLVVAYYRLLYTMAGDMDLVWKSVQRSDMDMRRLLHLAASSSAVADGFLCELSCLTDALEARDCDKACRIYTNHLNHISLLLDPLRRHTPEYFVPPLPQECSEVTEAKKQPEREV